VGTACMSVSSAFSLSLSSLTALASVSLVHTCALSRERTKQGRSDGMAAGWCGSGRRGGWQAYGGGGQRIPGGESLAAV